MPSSEVETAKPEVNRPPLFIGEATERCLRAIHEARVTTARRIRDQSLDTALGTISATNARS